MEVDLTATTPRSPKVGPNTTTNIQPSSPLHLPALGTPSEARVIVSQLAHTNSARQDPPPQAAATPKPSAHSTLATKLLPALEPTTLTLEMLDIS